MPLTLAQQEDFLKSDLEKIILCDIEYHDGTQLRLGTFSTYPYVTNYNEVFVWKYSNTTYINRTLTGVTISINQIICSNITDLYSTITGLYVFNATQGKYAKIISVNSVVDFTVDIDISSWLDTDTLVIDAGAIISNVAYDDILLEIPDIIEKIDADINVGAIEFLNAEGEYDNYINYGWEGHNLKLYVGHYTWPKQDFIPVIEAVASTITSPRPNIMALNIRDKKEIFNVKVQTEVITHDYIYDLYGINRNYTISDITVYPQTNSWIIKLNNADLTNVTYIKLAGKDYQFDVWVPAVAGTNIDECIIDNSYYISEANYWKVGDSIDFFTSTNPVFSKDVNNIVEPIIPIQVNIDSNYTNIEIARTTADTLSTVAGSFTGAVRGAGEEHIVEIDTIAYGDTTDTLDYSGNTYWSEYATNFIINKEHATNTLTGVTPDIGGYQVLNFSTGSLQASTYIGGMVYNVDLGVSALVNESVNNSDTQMPMHPIEDLISDGWASGQTVLLYRLQDHNNGDLRTGVEQGERTTLEIPQSITPADLSGKFFTINTVLSKFYVWYNVNYTSVDPEYVETIPESFNPTVHVIPDTILNSPVPITLGKCFNIEPKLIDVSNHIYQVHEAAIDDIYQVRANGVMLDPDTQYEVNKEIGCFRLLTHSLNTQITCDVYGARDRGVGNDPTYTIYKYTAPWLIEWLALNKTSLTKEDICTGTFPVPSRLYSGPHLFSNYSELGVYITDEVDVHTLVFDIMASVGGHARFGRVCAQPGGADKIKLQIFELEEPNVKALRLLNNNYTILELTEDQILENGLSLALTEPPRHTVTLGYRKNWHIQERGTLAGLLTDPNNDYLYLVDLYTNEFSKVFKRNEGILDKYPLAEDTEVISTYLYTKVDATNEVNKRAILRNTKRFVFKIETTLAPLTLGIGDIVKVTYNRFGFNFGRYATIIGLQENPVENRVTMEIWL